MPWAEPGDTAATPGSTRPNDADSPTRKLSDPAPVTYRWDINRDGYVNATDQILAQLEFDLDHQLAAIDYRARGTRRSQ